MKKILAILALLSVFTVGLVAQSKYSAQAEKDDSKWSELSYVNVPILKILEGKDAYVVVYQKNKVGTDTVVVPKKWAKGTPEAPKKLKFRAVPTAKKAYMTVVKKEGEFNKVVLSVPMAKSNEIWGLVDYHKPIEGSDKDTLEELEF